MRSDGRQAMLRVIPATERSGRGCDAHTRRPWGQAGLRCAVPSTAAGVPEDPGVVFFVVVVAFGEVAGSVVAGFVL